MSNIWCISLSFLLLSYVDCIQANGASNGWGSSLWNAVSYMGSYLPYNSSQKPERTNPQNPPKKPEIEGAVLKQILSNPLLLMRLLTTRTEDIADVLEKEFSTIAHLLEKQAYESNSGNAKGSNNKLNEKLTASDQITEKKSNTISSVITNLLPWSETEDNTKQKTDLQKRIKTSIMRKQTKSEE